MHQLMSDEFYGCLKGIYWQKNSYMMSMYLNLFRRKIKQQKGKGKNEIYLGAHFSSKSVRYSSRIQNQLAFGHNGFKGNISDIYTGLITDEK